MNILILNWRGPGHPHAGGAEIATMNHAIGWVKAGHNVTWFTSSFNKGKDEEVIDNIQIIRKGREVFGVQLEAFLWILFGKHPKIDLIVDQFHGIPFFTPLYTKTPKIAYIHEVAKNVWALNPWPFPFNLVPRIIGGSLEPLVFKLVYRNIVFLTVSESTKKDLTEWGINEGNISVIYNGNNSPSKRYSKANKPVVVYLGALAKDKGIEDALYIFSLVNKTIKDAELWIVGKSDKDYKRNLVQLTKKLDISSKVKFWGFVSDSAKYRLLSKAWVLINPSVREGWGLVNIEANSVGTPAVAYDVEGCRDSIKNNETGILVDFNDTNQFAKEIIDLLSSTKRLSILSQNAISWSKKFDWKVSINKSLDLIQKVVK